jgi:hypothetical protein
MLDQFGRSEIYRVLRMRIIIHLHIRVRVLEEEFGLSSSGNHDFFANTWYKVRVII